MNEAYGKRRFSGSDSSETLLRIFTKFGTFDYVGDTTPHANVGINRFKGGRVCARVKLSRSGDNFFSLFRSHAHRYT